MAAFDYKSLLEYIRGVPEWQAALLHEQRAVLNRTAAVLNSTNANMEQGFADSKLRPDRYFRPDSITRRDWLTDDLSKAAAALGEALAALEMTSALSDVLPQDLSHMARYSRDLRYTQLYELCLRHGYKEEK